MRAKTMPSRRRRHPGNRLHDTDRTQQSQRLSEPQTPKVPGVALWGGTAEGITGTHEWVYTQTSTGVHVATQESFAGVPVAADITGMQSALDTSLTDWLGHLKTAAKDPV
jgi:hypothetical protein